MYAFDWFPLAEILSPLDACLYSISQQIQCTLNLVSEALASTDTHTNGDTHAEHFGATYPALPNRKTPSPTHIPQVEDLTSPHSHDLGEDETAKPKRRANEKSQLPRTKKYFTRNRVEPVGNRHKLLRKPVEISDTFFS